MGFYGVKNSRSKFSCLGTFKLSLLNPSYTICRGVTKRCRLSLLSLTNSALVIRVQMRGEGGSCGVSANEYSCAHHVTWSPNILWRSNSIFNLWLYVSHSPSPVVSPLPLCSYVQYVCPPPPHLPICPSSCSGGRSCGNILVGRGRVAGQDM